MLLHILTKKFIKVQRNMLNAFDWYWIVLQSGVVV
jgi:hypothetical protein